MKEQLATLETEIEGFRLSPQQKHLWVLQQGISNQPFLTQAIVHIEGPLQVEVLDKAVQIAVDRNEILRTTFRCLAGMNIPVQVINNNIQVAIHYEDLSAWEPQEQEARIDTLAHELRQLHFSFDQGPLIYLLLLALTSRRHILLITSRALCLDRVGAENLVREISSSYAASESEAALNDTMMQYADLAEWQNGLLESEEAEEERAYWYKQDFSAIEKLYLPGEKQRAGDPEFTPRHLTITLDREMQAKVASLAQDYETSTAALLFSCWQILLWRLTGKSDLIVGVTSDGRTYEELKEALGLFAKTLPVCCHLQDRSLFCDLLKQVDQSLRDVAERQEYFNWEQLATSARNADRPAFLPFSFEFQDEPAEYTAGDITFSIRKQYAYIDLFKMKLSCAQIDELLTVELHYDSHLFSQEVSERLASEFITLVGSALTHPDGAIGELEIVSSDERRQLLREFNRSEADFPSDTCIHELFVAQVERTPENRAALFENQCLTYRELNVRANQLAHYLQKLGVGPEVLVGVCLERSLELVVALLGILKAGGAYIPLDPSYPQERLAYMMTDAQIAVLLTEDRLKDLLPEQDIHVVCMDADSKAIASESEENPLTAVGPGHLAYIIYTSGSTGQPKGVMIEHRSVVNYLCWVTENLLSERVHNLPLVTRLTFDASLKQIFGPLLRGESVWILPDDVVADPAALLNVLSTRNEVALNCVPSLWSAMLDHAPSNEVQVSAERITNLFVGGEQLSKDLVDKSFAALPHLHIYNLYGPTEATANASSAKISSGGEVCIGRPIANTQIYLLDDSLQLVPIGVPGELYIGGAGLARGYLRCAALTAERFLPHPFSTEPGARLYRTGDRARYLPTGDIEFLGRLDSQVKIRGFRIELGEIEAVLRQHPAVRAAAVAAREDVPGQKHLVAYIVANDEHSPSLNQLVSYVKSQLPDYMLPSTFVMLETLPLMPNGKIDRRALPAPDKTNMIGPEESFVAPRTPVEEVLAVIWGEILGIERVGVHDNFFELGGNSLLIMKMVSQLREIFHVRLPLRTLLEVSTVAELASIIVAQEAQPGQIEQRCLALLQSQRSIPRREVSY